MCCNKYKCVSRPGINCGFRVCSHIKIGQVIFVKMPSVYNYENACWGNRKPSCDMFQYDDNEDLQTRKLRGLGPNPHSNNAVPNSTYVHYSVSSNGYYGYQPHKVLIEGNNDSEMDVDITVGLTSSNVGASSENISMFDCETFPPDLQVHNVRRKRQMTSDSENGSKRIRQEEAETEGEKSPIQESHQYGGGSSLRRRRQGAGRVYSSEGDYESTTQLLRQTHGCELYLFERTCDY